MTVDLDALKAVRPGDATPTESFLTTERARLVELATLSKVPTIGQRTHHARSHRAGRGRRWWLLIPAAAVFTAATTVYALTAAPDPAPTGVTCRFDAKTTSIIDAVSGDPTVDCAALWRRTRDSDPPALQAYRIDESVLVLRADDSPPDGAIPIDPRAGADAPPNTALIELDARLHDYASGLRSTPCIPFDETVDRVNADLTDLRLTDTWIVRAEAPTAPSWCGLAYLDADARAVVVRGVDPIRWTAERSTPQEVGYRNLGHAVANAVDTECLSVDDAADRTRAIADSLGFAGAEIHTTVDRLAQCSRVTLTVTGSINIVIRGPRST